MELNRVCNKMLCILTAAAQCLCVCVCLCVYLLYSLFDCVFVHVGFPHYHFHTFVQEQKLNSSDILMHLI